MSTRMGADDRREQIADAALAVMRDHGAHGLTAARLCEAAGISRGNLFHHFDSVNDVVLAAFDLAVSRAESLASPPADLRAWLLALGTDAGNVGSGESSPPAGVLAFVSRAQADPRLQARIEAMFDRSVEKVGVLLNERVTPQVPPHEMAALLVIVADGFAMSSQALPDRGEQRAAAWRAFVDLVAPVA